MARLGIFCISIAFALQSVQVQAADNLNPAPKRIGLMNPTQLTLTPALPPAPAGPTPLAPTAPTPTAAPAAPKVTGDIETVQPNAPAAPGGLKSIVNNMGDSKAVRPNKKEIILPVLEKSLMFTPDELNKIKMVYNIYLERQKTTNNKEVVDKTPNVEDLLGRLNMGAPPELPPAPVGIYLDSILFRAPGNASAWINGKKYEIGISQNNIQLIKVASNYAEIEWRISGYNNATIGDWSDIFPEIDDDDAEKRSNSMPPSRQAIKVNAETKAVQVILKPNQYLDTKAKAVKEGRPVMPKDVAGVNSKNGLPNNNSPLGKLSMPEKSEEKTPESEVKKVDTTVAPQKEVKIKASENGHYDISATINGQVVTFRVDTGATYPVISKDDAKRLGIDVDKLQYSFEAKIADGTIIKSAEATVDVMTIEGLTFEKVLIMVANGNFPQPLLGSSFLNTINYNMSGGVMTITK